MFGPDRTPNTGYRRAVSTRSGPEVIDELRDVLDNLPLGLSATPPEAEDVGADLVLRTPTGDRFIVELKRASSVSSAELVHSMAELRQKPYVDTSVLVLLVADRVTADAREMMRAAGWSWLDLRGHLHLAGPGLFVDTGFPARERRTGRSAPLSGQVGVEVAVSLLLAPQRSVQVRGLARKIKRAASSVSETLAGMRQDGLVDADRKPVLPELFWELATHWRPEEIDIAVVPPMDNRDVTEVLRLGLDHVPATSGWALTDTVAAAAYGAPVGVRADYPPDFYVPDRATLRRARHLLGVASDHGNRAGTLRWSLVAEICADRVEDTMRSGRWPLAQPLFVALDLAQDPDRGREVLASWTPPREWPRVW